MTGNSFAPTHRVPDTGLPAWTQPDGAVEPVANLSPRLPVVVIRQWGDWSELRCSNDWTGWVDGRRLETISAVPGAAPGVAPAVSAAAAAHVEPRPDAAAGGTPTAAPAGGAVRSYADLYARARPAGRSPAGIAAAAAAEVPAERQRMTPIIIGALLVAAGAFLPWLTFPSTPSRGSPSIPLQFLADIRTTAQGPIDLVVPLLVAAAVGVGATVVPGWARARRIAGWSVVVMTSIFVGQLQRLLGDFGAGGPSLVSAAGIGVLVTLVGGLVLALAPDVPAGTKTGHESGAS